jgi:hypothetical protein
MLHYTRAKTGFFEATFNARCRTEDVLKTSIKLLLKTFRKIRA